MAALAIHHDMIFAIGDVIGNGFIFINDVTRLIKVGDFKFSTSFDTALLWL